MYQLYYSPGACSMAPHVILNEVGAQFELKKISLQDGDGQKPEFLKINSRGQVPVLVDDGFVIREGAAILIHLMEKHKSPLLPASGKERTTALEWLMFGNASMHPAYAKGFFVMKNVSDKAAQEQLFTVVIGQINKLWEEVEARLAVSAYVCGKDITAADILLTVIANWGGYFPVKPTFGPNAKRLFKEVIARPSYQKALATEQVEYKAAA